MYDDECFWGRGGMTILPLRVQSGQSAGFRALRRLWRKLLPYRSQNPGLPNADSPVQLVEIPQQAEPAEGPAPGQYMPPSPLRAPAPDASAALNLNENEGGSVSRNISLEASLNERNWIDIHPNFLSSPTLLLGLSLINPPSPFPALVIPVQAMELITNLRSSSSYPIQ